MIITIDFLKIGIFIYIVSKILLAIYLQQCLLKTDKNQVKCFGIHTRLTKNQLWINFFLNLICSLELTILSAIMYPFNILITGRNKSFLDDVLPEEYTNSKLCPKCLGTGAVIVGGIVTDGICECKKG